MRPGGLPQSTDLASSGLWAVPSPRQLTSDEGFDHLTGAFRLGARLGNPLVLAALEDGQLAYTASRAVRRRELLLDGGQHVVVESALHDEQRHQGHLLPVLEDLLRIALVDRLPRVEVDPVVLDHRVALRPLRLLEPRVRVADGRARRYVRNPGIDTRGSGQGNRVVAWIA